MKKNIFVLLGHPDKETLSGEMADLYAKEAEAAGHSVRIMRLGEMNFDPILHKGYKEIQELEPDLVQVQENMKWADHFVIVYPNWWCTMPAILKGMFDRMFLPGFAFRFRKDRPGWDQLMKGKTARVIVLANTHPLLIHFLFGDYTNEISRGILGFAGYKVQLTKFGPTEKVAESKVLHWKEKVGNLAQRGI